MRRLVTTFTLALIGTTVAAQEGLKRLIGKFATAGKSFGRVVDPRTPHGVLESQFGFHLRRLKVDFPGQYLHYKLGAI